MDPHSLLLTDAATDSDMVIGRLLRLSVTLVGHYGYESQITVYLGGHLFPN